MADVVIFFFFHSVPEMKTLCTSYSINFAPYLQKHMRSLKTYEVIEFQWQPFQAKKSIANVIALNYISPKVYRVTHHAEIFTVTTTTNAT